jgi:hypothetical protein
MPLVEYLPVSEIAEPSVMKSSAAALSGRASMAAPTAAPLVNLPIKLISESPPMMTLVSAVALFAV